MWKKNILNTGCSRRFQACSQKFLIGGGGANILEIRDIGRDDERAAGEKLV